MRSFLIIASLDHGIVAKCASGFIGCHLSYLCSGPAVASPPACEFIASLGQLLLSSIMRFTLTGCCSWFGVGLCASSLRIR